MIKLMSFQAGRLKRRFDRLAPKAQRMLGGGMIAMLLLAFAPLAIQQSGLNSAPPVGQYIDGLLPSTTPAVSTPTSLSVVNAFNNVAFTRATHMAEEPTTDRMYVSEKEGIIYGFDMNAVGTPAKSTFLDISAKTSTNGESGLLSFAFHPDYQDSNYVYVFYQYESGGDVYSRVSRFTVPTAGGAADINSELVLIHQYDRDKNHNGGMLLFGNDGYLYIAFGDEGGSNNQFDNSQYLDKRLFGGILRIDVDRDSANSHPIRRQPSLIKAGDNSFTQHYLIPNTNPWLDAGGAYLEEFYAIGLRNPYRLGLDVSTGDIYIGDVGQNHREEVNLLAAGANYEWPYKEGTRNGYGSAPANHFGTDTPPIHEYDHSVGNCIVGGTVYRGTANPSLVGKYVFADNGASTLFEGTTGGVSMPAQSLMQTTVTSGGGLVAFGTDLDNELYFINFDIKGRGKIYTFSSSTLPGGSTAPALLSQLGIFKDMATLEPDSFMIPYQPNVPFWSDDALKYRWVIIPNDGNPNTAAEQIAYSEEGPWNFPEGTIFVKHFEMQTDETNPATTTRLETRLMVQGPNGDFYGISYKWLPSQLDAELITGGTTDTVSINTPNGPREITWYYPTRAECLTCHKIGSGSALGLKTAQVNGDMTYPSTGITANQLKTFTYMGFFDQTPDTNNLASLPRFPDINDPAEPIEDRAMAYLDANCAYCHNPSTGVFAQFDARSISTNDFSTLIYGEVYNSVGISGGRAFVPSDLEHSIIYQRMSSLKDGIAMPPLSKNKLDTTGMNLLEEWVNSMSPSFGQGTAIPTNGLLASYSLDGVSGTTATDASGNGLDGTLQNGPAWSGGQVGNSLSFDGNDDLVQIPDPTNVISFPTNSFTLAAWINIDNYPSVAGGIITRGITDMPVALHLRPNGGLRLIINEFASGGVTRQIYNVNSYLIPGSWYHIAVTYDGTTLRFYVDGILISTSTQSYVLQTTTEPLCIGVYNNRNFDGRIDEVNIYDRSLDATEVGLLANSTGTVQNSGQRIDFPELDNMLTSDGPLTLNATATSTLPVSYSIIEGPAILAGNILTLTGDSGYVTIEATQAGNVSFEPAPSIRRTFFVAPSGYMTGTGLQATYFDNIDLTNQVMSRVDSVVDFYWGSGSPDPAMEYGTYSVRWEGEIEPPYSGTYTFTTTTDDGVRLWVNNQLLIDEWQNQAVSEFSGTISLTALQKANIKLEYFEYSAYSEVELSWAHAEIDQEIIPKAFLYPDIGNSLPIDLLAFDANLVGSRVLIDWETNINPTAQTFIVEKAGTDYSFAEIDRQAYNPAQRFYQSFDQEPQHGSNFYRLTQIDIDGAISHSDIREVRLDGPQTDLFFRAYPIPVGNDRLLTLDFQAENERTLTVDLISSSGKVTHSQAIGTKAGVFQKQLDLSGMAPGVYLIRVTDPDQVEPVVQRILIQ